MREDSVNDVTHSHNHNELAVPPEYISCKQGADNFRQVTRRLVSHKHRCFPQCRTLVAGAGDTLYGSVHIQRIEVALHNRLQLRGGGVVELDMDGCEQAIENGLRYNDTVH